MASVNTGFERFEGYLNNSELSINRSDIFSLITSSKQA
jgi:hypothetical protein